MAFLRIDGSDCTPSSRSTCNIPCRVRQNPDLYKVVPGTRLSSDAALHQDVTEDAG